MRITLYVLGFLLLISCSDDRKILDIDKIPISTLQKDTAFTISEMFMPTDMYIVKENIIFTCNSTGSKHLFHLYNKNDCKYNGSFTFYGKGNNEAYHLNLAYLYSNNDSIFVNTNDFYESIYKIKDSKLVLISNKRTIAEELFLRYFKVSNNKFVGCSEEISEEYAVVEVNNKKITRTNVGKYPEYPMLNINTLEKASFYGKWIATLSDSIYAFYDRVPLVRKYDSQMKLIKEVQLGDLNITKPQDKMKMRTFARVRVCNEKIFAIFINKGNFELIVFDSDINPIRRYMISNTIRGFDVDADFIYLFDPSKDLNRIVKYKYESLQENK